MVKREEQEGVQGRGRKKRRETWHETEEGVQDQEGELSNSRDARISCRKSKKEDEDGGDSSGCRKSKFQKGKGQGRGGREGSGGFGFAIAAAQRKIWSPNVRSGNRDTGLVNGDDATRARQRTLPQVELARWMKVKKLRQKLHQMCSKVGQPVPLLAFERWQFNSKLREALCETTTNALETGKDKSRESCPTASKEPLLPSREGWIDEDLVHDLVRGNVKQESAEEIAKQLAYSSAKYAHELAALQSAEEAREEAHSEEGGGQKEVVTRVVEGVVDLFWGSEDEKPYMRISRAHFEKLRILFARHREAGGGEEEEDGQAFLGAVFCVLLRYDALGGHGYQAALGSESFDVLLAQMNCTHECFASPFNCRYDRFCSAFHDVDAPFGSVGSFFAPNFAPSRGCYEANPPFVPKVMELMVKKLERLLASPHAGALSFVVVVPAWSQLPYWKALEASQFLRVGRLLVPAAEHEYVDGAQHQRKPSERHRPSSFDTAVFILQNDKAFKSEARLLTITEQLRAAMCKNKGSVEDIASYEHRVKKKKITKTQKTGGEHL